MRDLPRRGSIPCAEALRLDFNSVEVNERAAVIVLSPGDSNSQRLSYGDQFGMARRGVPFAHDVRAEAFFLQKPANCRYGVLVRAIPVFSEIVSLEKLFQPFNPLRFHSDPTFYHTGKSHPQSSMTEAYVQIRATMNLMAKIY